MISKSHAHALCTNVICTDFSLFCTSFMCVYKFLLSRMSIKQILNKNVSFIVIVNAHFVTQVQIILFLYIQTFTHSIVSNLHS